VFIRHTSLGSDQLRLITDKVVLYTMSTEGSEARTPTALKLDKPPDSVAKGTLLEFTGKLVREDKREGLEGLTVQVMDSDVGGDDILGEGTTGPEGRFTVQWLAKPSDPLDETVEVYARFPGDEDHEAAQDPEEGHHTVRIVEDPTREASQRRKDDTSGFSPPIR
jgi:hypothetical protein